MLDSYYAEAHTAPVVSPASEQERKVMYDNGKVSLDKVFQKTFDGFQISRIQLIRVLRQTYCMSLLDAKHATDDISSQIYSINNHLMRIDECMKNGAPMPESLTQRMRRLEMENAMLREKLEER